MNAAADPDAPQRDPRKGPHRPEGYLQMAARGLPFDRAGAVNRAGGVRASGFPLEALLRACRPRQWVKNVLVFAAPGLAGVLGDPGRPDVRVLLHALERHLPAQRRA